MKKLFASLLFLLTFMLTSECLADDNTPPPPPPPPAPTVESLQAELNRIKKENEELKKKPPAGGSAGDDDDGDDPLVKKAKKDIEDKKKSGEDAKEVERSVRFNLGLEDFVKTNKTLLPEEIDGILSHAKAEKYDSEGERASAMKSAILTSFFAVQANVDQLSPTQKNALDTWKGLTKKDREARAGDAYENIFEPVLDKIKAVRKAEEAGRARAGLAPRNSTNSAYSDRLVKLSQEQFGVKPRIR